MRVGLSLSLLLFLAVSLVAAWSKEDHEIFRLNDEVQAHEGHNVTFYEFIGVKPSATLDDINKAYRKKSRALHPDKARQKFISSYPLKNKGKQNKKAGVRVSKGPSQKEINAFNKQASERFARLGLVANILRSETRDRYDHFLRNGFPKWRGTGYYYARFRPGLISVLLGLFAFGGFVQYGALYLGWKRQRDFVERYIRHARRMAWGDDSGVAGVGNLLNSNVFGNESGSASATATPPRAETPTGEDGPSMPMNRRQKRQQEKEDRKSSKKSAKAVKVARTSGISTPQEPELISAPRGAKKRVVAENGKVLIVDSTGNVFLEEETEEGETHEYLLDADEIAKPTLSDTILVTVPRWFYKKSLGRLVNKATGNGDVSPVVLTPPESEDEQETAIKTAVSANQNSETRRRKNKNGVK